MRGVRYFAAGCLFTSLIALGAWEVRHRKPEPVPVDPTVPIPEPRVPSHLAVMERNRRGPVGVLFVGDSITAYWRCYPWLWNEAFGKFDPCNAGVDGDQTGHVLWRLQHGELDNIKPRVVVVLIGTNNIGIGHDDGGTTAIGVGRVVGEIQKRLPDSKILLLGLLPRFDQFAREVPKCNAVLSTYAGGNVVYFDPGSSLTAEDFADGLHLSPKGMEHMGGMLAPKITEPPTSPH